MDNRVALKTGVVVRIVTEDLYLNKGLQILINESMECYNSLQSGVIPDYKNMVHVVLVDTRCLGAGRAEWKKLSKVIREADRYAFISYSDASLDEISHLSLLGAVADLRHRLACFITTLADNKPSGSSKLLSRLNYIEQLLVTFLIYEFNINELHEIMKVSKKCVCRVRSQVMQKYRLKNRKELHTMLKLHEFVSYMSTEKVISDKSRKRVHTEGRADICV
uniref:HTH luxR-type domain-containing protein n=1 Tax=Pectobacterium carotovorum TaxID=554 RepID=A0A0N9NR58_PECCA|nr:hypothetical protein [Pectobacterium carotovorum]ALG88541.1 Hypothetical protein [Pectobacterium carotovorum]